MQSVGAGFHYLRMLNSTVQVEDDPNSKMDGGAILATFETHEDARKAAARMIENDFPANQIVLVGFGFYMLERVRRPRHYGKAARESGTFWAFFGLGYGVSAGAFYIPFLPPEFQFGGSIIACIMVFGGLGILFGVTKYALKKDKPIVDSSEEFFATRYRIEVPEKALAQARRALEGKAESPVFSVRE